MLGLLVVLTAAPAAAQPSPRQREPEPAAVAAREPTLLEAARAQRAYDVPPPRLQEVPSQGIALSFGWTAQHGGAPGWVARFDHELIGVEPEGRRAGAIYGMAAGFEYWQVNPSEGERDFGFSTPVAMIGGIRAFPIRAVVGAGLDAILVDHVARETGVGFYAPFALANLSFDIDGFRLGLDARVERRWQFSADDHTQFQLVVNFGSIIERGRRRR